MRQPTTLDAAAVLAAGVLGMTGAGAALGGPPADGEAGPGCPFRLVTGLPCPFCGTTRSLLTLGEGDLGGAVALSPLGPIALALSLVVLGALALAALPVRPLRRPPGLVPALTTLVLVVWTVQLVRGAP